MLLSQEQLAEALHFAPNQTAKIEACLKSQGITYFYGKGGCVWTTTELIARAGAQGPATNDSIRIDNHHGQAA